MSPRRARRLKAFPDRVFRALARAEPERILALLHVVAPGLVPAGKRVTPAHVDDPHLDASPHPIDGDYAVRVGRRDLVHAEFQGYRDQQMALRIFSYHLGFVARYPDRVVHSVVFWLIRPPANQRQNWIARGNVIVRVHHVVLPETSAAGLLRRPETACFAAAADPGAWSIDELCRRVVEEMQRGGATRDAWRVAIVAAAVEGRYKELVKAMQQAKVDAPVYDDFTRLMEDLGYRRGRRQGLKQGRLQGVEQGVEQGLQQGLRRALVATYEARFGAVPPRVASAVEAMHDEGTLLEWQARFSTATAAEIAAALGPQRRQRNGTGRRG